MPRGKSKSSGIELTRSQRVSPFDLRKHGIAPDPSKDRRWVRKDRIDERKEIHGYVLVPGKSVDGTTTVKGMVLMERSQDKADESSRQKELRTRQQTQSSREAYGQEVEKLSRKYDMDLHKAVKDLEK